VNSPQKRQILGLKIPVFIPFAIIALGLISRLFYKASLDSGDFLVYWRASHAWIFGTAFPWGVIDPTIPGFVFKYPPWILPIFTPFGWMQASIAQYAWALLELWALIYAIYKTISFGVRPAVAYFCALCMWWIWQEQFWSGQITILMMAVALWIAPMGKERTLPKVFVAYVYTAKIFSVVTLLGIWRELFRPKALLIGALFAILPTVLVVLVLRSHGFTDSASHPIGVIELFRQFMASANSGGVSLGENVIRGPINHGFTAAILRSFKINSAQSTYDMIVPIILTAILGPIWAHYSKPLDSIAQWLGWIALGAVIHPLAWDHTFVLVYPFCSLALDRAIRARRTSLIVWAFLGLACVGLVVPNVIGTELVKPFDFIGAKSWGILMSAAALIFAQKGAQKRA
jgi:hypothetical protein